MTQKLSEEEVAELRTILSQPTLNKAIDIALGELWKDKRGAITTEQSALNYQFHDGACSLLNKLMFFSEKKKDMIISPNRLRHNI